MNANVQRHPLVAGNWKMHGSREMASGLLQSLIHELRGTLSEVDIAVCPPSILLPLSEEILQDSALALGAQNLYPDKSGPFTGEIAPTMLHEYSVKYVIVGHSERRHLFGEDNQLVAAKFDATQRCSMTPILCVGETLEEREAGSTGDVVAAQLKAVLDNSGIEAFAGAVIAYEPVWAIGTGKTASAKQAQEVHAFIRGTLAEHSATVATNTRIIYGGSVKSDSAKKLFSEAEIDGGLIGGASLDAQEFAQIARAAISG